ncbi:minor capsid protein [Capybara microvirus Cap1_SP_64]|nr:minor capsid protein [Capybara microvirus Cap1_SP_64]
MEPITTTAIVSALGSLIGTTLSSSAQKKINKENQLNLLKNAQTSFNKYNSLSALKSQALAAGFNPNSISNQGQNQNVGSSQSVAPTYNFDSLGSTLLQFAQLKQQQKLIDSEVNKNNAEAENIRNTTPTKDKFTEKYDTDIDINKANVENIRQSTEESKHNVDLIVSQQILNADQIRINDETVNKLQSETQHLIKQNRALDNDNKLFVHQFTEDILKQISENRLHQANLESYAIELELKNILNQKDLASDIQKRILKLQDTLTSPLSSISQKGVAFLSLFFYSLALNPQQTISKAITIGQSLNNNH